ncbi:MAG: hypothetical protein ACTHOD_03070 [Motilibacteraceae bacterium]
MTVRWPFKAAVVLLVLGVIAWAGATRGHRAWQNHQDRERLAAQRVEMAPTAQLLLQMAPPPGMRNCGHEEWTRQIGDLCWQGSLTPGRTALALGRELRRVGGTDVVEQCARWSTNLRPGCTVRATVGGRTWGALIFWTSLDGSSGVQLAGSAAFPPKFPSGTPVPPEQA